MKKILIVFISLLMLHTVNAQVTGIRLQASGLTCSMCSNAINKSLKTLPFVANVVADIKTSGFEIELKPDMPFGFDEIKKKVEDAGFSVAKLTAKVNFGSTEVDNDSHVKVGANNYHFLNISKQQISGVKEIRLLDKGFVTSKEYKKNSKFTKMKCYETGKAGSCCSSSEIKEGDRIYHVTL